MGNQKKNMGGQQLPGEDTAIDKLAAFSALDENEMEEGTSTYHKFTQPGEVFDGLFKGTDQREFDADKNPGKMTECAILEAADGSKHLFAQTIVVNELKKKWDELKETDFPVRIKYMGLAKAGTPEQYQNFRLFYAPVSK